MQETSKMVESASDSHDYLSWANKYPNSKERDKWDKVLADLIDPDRAVAYSPKQLRDIAVKLCHQLAGGKYNYRILVSDDLSRKDR